jgi:NADH-quinone oxidoreductase subunit M
MYLVILLAAVGLPLTSGFPGELLILIGLAKQSLWLAAIAGLSIIFGAVYMLVSYKSAMLGKLKEEQFSELITREKVVFAILILLIFIVGIFPSVLLKTSEASADLLVNLFLAR